MKKLRVKNRSSGEKVNMSEKDKKNDVKKVGKEEKTNENNNS